MADHSATECQLLAGDGDNKPDDQKQDSILEQNKSSSPSIKHDWYQTETHVTVTILAKNVNAENVYVNYPSEHGLNVSAKITPECTYNLHLDLAHRVIPRQSAFKVLSSKIEIKLKKADGTRWVALEGEPKISIPQSGRNWDKLATEIEDEKAEGEAALNALFQKIYSEGSDEVKKAMNKSFMESGGTVLSTNWNEVSKDKVDIKPPDGMEWKKWE